MHATDMQRVLDQTHAKGAAWQVLIVLTHHANADSREAFPSLERLVEETNLTRKGVQNGIARLVELGEITFIQGGGAVRNNYRIDVGQADVPPFKIVSKHHKPANVVPEPAYDVHPSVNGEPAYVVPEPANVMPEPAYDVPGTGVRRTPEPSLEPSIEPKEEPKAFPGAVAREEIPIVQRCLQVPGCTFTGAWVDHLPMHAKKRKEGRSA